MNKHWINFALFGALWYGIYSFLLEFIDKEISNSLNLSLGYGLLIGCLGTPLVFIIYGIIHIYLYPYTKIVFTNLNWKIFYYTALLAVLTLPLHSLVINSGASLGQEVMYTTAIIPVLIFSWYFHKERLSKRHWLGIVLAAFSVFLMNN